MDQETVTSYPQVVVVRVPTPWVQSDSDITVLRHLEKMGCRLINRPQAILNCVNKFWTFQELAGHGIPLPDTFSYGESCIDVISFVLQHVTLFRLKESKRAFLHLICCVRGIYLL